MSRKDNFLFFIRAKDVHVGDETQRISFIFAVTMPGTNDWVPKSEVEEAIRWKHGLQGKSMHVRVESFLNDALGVLVLYIKMTCSLCQLTLAAIFKNVYLITHAPTNKHAKQRLGSKGPFSNSA